MIANLLLAIGYPVSIGMIARWFPIVRQRRVRWFIVHQAAVALIVAGWALKHDPGVVPNGLWLSIAAIWYYEAGHRPSVTSI